jgi:hypothetical protein
MIKRNDMNVLSRFLANVVSVRVITLLMALFIGHMVNAAPVVPQCSVAAAALASDWHTTRQQYNPSYIAHLEMSCTPAAAPVVPDWRATRQQYDPTYMDRLQMNSIQPVVISPVVPDWHATRQQYDPTYRSPSNEQRNSYISRLASYTGATLVGFEFG